MKQSKVTDLLIGIILLFLVGIAVTFYLTSPKTVPPPTHERILYLKDSLEMEFYKQALDTSYYYDHSKIPTDESNP